MGQARQLIKLAPGIRLCCDADPARGALWVARFRKVPLNPPAVAILELCDGSRSRERVVFDLVVQSGGTMRAADIMDFLDAARARGWLIETA